MIQDWLDGTVLMVGYMNQEAILTSGDQVRPLLESLTPNTVAEGESSGHVLRVKDLFVDCDRDTILVKARTGWAHLSYRRARLFFQNDGAGQAGEEKTQDAGGGILERLYQNGLPAESPSSARIHTSRNCCRAELTGF